MLKGSKRILYIAGCGRSGTTILGFALGGFARTIDLGEILDYTKFKGRPNGFGPGTRNYQFWDSVMHDVESRLGGLDFERLAHLQNKLDSHRALLRSFLIADGESRKGLTQYRAFLSVLYARLLEDDRFDVIIDSSKYPSRLQHLLRLFEDNTVCVVHLMRNPIELARAFRKDEQSGKKSFIESMLYFFVMNTLITHVTRGLAKARYQRIYFEDFIAEPAEQIGRIADAFGLDAADALDRIRRHQPLPRGFIFNGNRMRVQETVRLERRPKVAAQRTLVERMCERALAAWFSEHTLTR